VQQLLKVDINTPTPSPSYSLGLSRLIVRQCKVCRSILFTPLLQCEICFWPARTSLVQTWISTGQLFTAHPKPPRSLATYQSRFHPTQPAARGFYPLSPKSRYKIGHIPPPFPLEAGPLESRYEIWGALWAPPAGLVGARPTTAFWCILCSNQGIWWHQF